MTSSPLTGSEYLESLRDGREVWIYGEKVKDVTDHVAFRDTASTMAGLYDALHDPSHGGVLRAETDTGGGTFTHPFFRAPRCPSDLRAAREAIASWQRLSYGWLGRSPDYMATLTATFGADADFYGSFRDNASAWYRRVQEGVLFLSHALVHPPVDRHLSPECVKDVYVRVERETDAGIVVSGAKVVATGAALTHFTFVAPVGAPVADPSLAVAFMAPLNTPGVKLVCRASYAAAAAATGSRFDYPLSSRFDENDTIIIFDSALIPWENVLINADPERANAFLHHSGVLPRFMFHNAVRMGVKLDFLCGLFLRAVNVTGTDTYRGVQAAVGEALAWRHAIHAFADSMVERAQPFKRDFVTPDADSATAYRILAPMANSQIKTLIENHVGSALMYLNSHADDFGHPDLRPYLDKYLRGSHGTSAQDRVKLMKLLWDSIGSEFASRNQLYERLSVGSPEQCRVDAFTMAQRSGLSERLESLTEGCLSGYEVDHG